MSSDKPPSRRAALRALTVLGAGAFGCALAVPTLRFVAAPAKVAGGGGGLWVKTVKLDALEEGKPQRVAIVADFRDAYTISKDVELGAAFLIRRGKDVTAISVACPHLGCPVQVKGEGYYCACHDSNFGGDGGRKDGPSPRDLDPFATKVEGGFVFVEFRRFKMGVPERIEV